MSDTVQVSFTINRDIFSVLRQDSDHFVPEMRLAAAVKWYELGILTIQSRRDRWPLSQ